MANGPEHLYVHVPYCEAKCPYCDFNSIAGRDEEHAAYVEAVLSELERLDTPRCHTVFIGGGTPTRLSPPLLERLVRGIRERIELSDTYEWTCEANPGSADRERFALLAAHGVNRVSIGVQSTHAQHLRFLGRVHDAEQAAAALDAARQHFARINADLIFALPDQSLEDIDTDLDWLLTHDLDHYSCYHLTFEPGTEFHARLRRGQLKECDAEHSHSVWQHLSQRLEAAGRPAYETSNFAIPGQECRHNLAYWQGRDYHAVGAGAVSTVADRRQTREAHPARYIAAIQAGQAAIMRDEHLSQRDRLIEAWMLGLRLRQGFNTDTLARHGDTPERWQTQLHCLLEEGLVEWHPPRLAISDQGRPLQDAITRMLMPEPSR